MPTLYAPGTAPVAVTPRGFAVLEPGASASLLTRIRSVLVDGRGLGGVIEALTGAYGASLTAIPAFAVALADGDGIRVAVRGDFAFDIDGAASESVSGAGVTTWTERVIPGAVRVALTATGSDGPAEFEIADGIVLASRIEWDAAPAGAPSAAGDAPAEAAPAPRRREVAAPAASEPADAGSAPAPAEAPAIPAAPVAPAPSAEEAPVRSAWTSHAAVAETPSANPGELIDSTSVPSVVDAETLLPLDSALTPPAATEVPLPPAGPAPAGDDEYASATAFDDVWGATVIRSADDGPVRLGEDVEPAPAAPPAGDHDGATISLAQARALREAAGGPGSAASGFPIDSAPAPLAPPRPPAPGRIRVSTGQVLPLDRTVVIGRRPRSTRVSGTDLPHLVAVDSPQQDISRSHVELRVEGESIVATDLRTTNGTTLLRQGADPVRLHPGESTVVIPGDVLDLGDGITVAIEGLS
ncbi:FHA domain-containing protein [Microbacterium sp. NPDC058062]|uniref:FHA domain-containing protein n=1 Tax=Microbacterium sp. NPDC058062 TaxID=3346320 RepID=UPI0036DBFF75